MAKSFGAECSNQLNDHVTHLVAGDKGTEKVKAARQRGKIFIVRKEWLFDSIKNWEHQPEEAYLLDEGGENSSPGLSEVEKTTETDEPHVSAEVTQHFFNTDWKVALHEVAEAIGESDDTSALEDSEAESGNESSYSTGNLKRPGDELAELRNAPFVKRLKNSPLRKTVEYSVNGDEDDLLNELNEGERDEKQTVKIKNMSVGIEDHRVDSKTPNIESSEGLQESDTTDGGGESDDEGEGEENDYEDDSDLDMEKFEEDLLANVLNESEQDGAADVV